MNLLHWKYAVEVEKTRSINKAADNLLMGQPNLSRAIKELEESLGITLFKRTHKGITVTPQGEEFLVRAKQILSQVEEVEAMYTKERRAKQLFSISVPRASYIATAFTSFVLQLDHSKPIEIFYKETNPKRAVSNILQEDYKLGIIRYQSTFESYFKAMLHEKGLSSQTLRKFSCVVLMSRDHPLADKDEIDLSDLCDYIEIAQPDLYVPTLPLNEAIQAERTENVDKRIMIFERGIQFDLLNNVTSSFMWVSPIPQRLLDRYGLVQKPCPENKKKYKDVLIYRRGYLMSELDKLFLDQLQRSIDME